ncbi:TPA: DNA (cytosine-5-)-methyltransferase [Campylobacter coli]|nr:DNA (cytosine-5-)-methyltransferase [Campylobacter coli]
MIYKTIDLFAGIGGIRKGFEKTNKFKNVLSAEIDKYACITYEHLYNENPYNDVSSEEFKKKIDQIKYDVLLAGFPCQAFSIAGKREGFLDKTRGTLFFDIADIIQRSKPKAFLLENVKGLLSHNKGETFNTILNVLIKDLGYKVVGIEEDMCGNLIYNKADFLRIATNFGIPQRRERVYIVGFRKDVVKNNKLNPLPTESKKVIYKDLNDLLEFKNEAKYYLSEGSLYTLEKHKKNHSSKGNGFGYEVVNDPSIKNPIANTILATGGSGKERNLIYDPQKGFEGLVVKGKKTRLNNKGIRIMTPREWGKLQGFVNYAFVDNNKDMFSFPDGVSETQQYKQFGNSVCIPVIEELAKYIYLYLDKGLIWKN